MKPVLDGFAGRPRESYLQPVLFAGEKAKTADHQALARAKDMQARGADPADIWKQTGWEQGLDGNWRFEIDDRNTIADMDTLAKALKTREPVASEDALMHPDYQKAYPDRQGVTMVRRQLGAPNMMAAQVGSELWVTPTNDPDTMRRMLLHETQHETGMMEGWFDGREAWRYYHRKSAEPYDKLSHKNRHAVLTHLYRAMRGDLYPVFQPEVEADNVERRRDFTPAQRRSMPPWTTERAKRSEQVYVRGNRLYRGGKLIGVMD